MTEAQEKAAVEMLEYLEVNTKQLQKEIEAKDKIIAAQKTLLQQYEAENDKLKERVEDLEHCLEREENKTIW